MASKGSSKDVRRPDLIIPYQEPAASGDSSDFSSTLSSTLPMAAIFMRNRYIGWAAFVFSVQSWLGESEESKKNSSTPGYFSVGMSRRDLGGRGTIEERLLMRTAEIVMSLAVTYLPFFLPPVPAPGGTATEAFPPVPSA
ncbi:hypothetical protein CONLIGDRAFT_643370 [Coniochaeta ligniaria NRRL 30616]|uniref:Uncharacterized protein n=1 Tax=Coniochaeta ligniaria NRRL 30616 TaxID=1408157 RepID=A0A1J7JND0_9PEZI|nr:hypothetical protein CONLIGDRAFT_643370 [Coniochaeta ligniaria NRRL 30616]